MTVEQLISQMKQGLQISLPLTADTPMLSSGILDSLHVAVLITLLERSYGVSIESSEIGVDNFDTPEQIRVFLSRKR